MAGDKIQATFEIQPDALDMLEHAAKTYGLPDKDKALRVVLDYLAIDANWDQIFTLVRCARCGNKGGRKPPAD